ncbi:unnamed protein product [Tetraodon nigroviridis]|uniref:Chromosome 2 SCAF14570, whole genome shotgun sequence n=1 Tax=Tetraodon nigroviridis TaxID=99883 RepID=Q4SK56_TETNG|nr:unnamed protein product [Tetraodon nigroviridis]
MSLEGETMTARPRFNVTLSKTLQRWRTELQDSANPSIVTKALGLMVISPSHGILPNSQPHGVGLCRGQQAEYTHRCLASFRDKTQSLTRQKRARGKSTSSSSLVFFFSLIASGETTWTAGKQRGVKKRFLAPTRSGHAANS